LSVKRIKNHGKSVWQARVAHRGPLQTAKHRLTLRDLPAAEAASLGPTLQKLEKGIYDYWSHKSLVVARVYMLYFLEGQLEPSSPW
jgi:hypothetical protein